MNGTSANPENTSTLDASIARHGCVSPQCSTGA